jgi:ApbE superfamily uncharacterized protein (UPF0280 family)
MRAGMTGRTTFQQLPARAPTSAWNPPGTGSTLSGPARRRFASPADGPCPEDEMQRKPIPPTDTERPRIDLTDGGLAASIVVDASPGAVEAARRAASAVFVGLAARLAVEVEASRVPARPDGTTLVDPLFRRMWRAVRPFSDVPVAPIVARDGAIAEEILAAVTAAAHLDRAVVTVGGAVALHLTPGFGFRAGLPLAAGEPAATVEVRPGDMVRGIGTAAGAELRPLFGIAETVTVSAQTAARAAAAAAVIADSVDLPGHSAVTRVPADLLDPGSPWGARPVVRAVGRLDADDVAAALAAGRMSAERMIEAGTISGCVVALRGELLTLGRVEMPVEPEMAASRRIRGRS